MLRRIVAFCRPLWPVLLLVSFPCSRSPVVDVLGLCRLLQGSFDFFLLSPHLRPQAVHNLPLCVSVPPPPFTWSQWALHI